MDPNPNPGFHRVDDHPEAPMLLATMDATAAWDATIRLRAWERTFLALVPGQRLLDVGCGLGDAALALAGGLGAEGEIVGVDASEVMIGVARQRATPAVCRTRFVVGDALALAEPAAAFDAVRSERALQWVPDPGTAVLEMARVLRPGGRMSLIDSDWSTFDLDVGDEDVRRIVRDAMCIERNRPSNVGGRLSELVTAAGLEVVDQLSATHHWDGWDPATSPGPAGFLPVAIMADGLVDSGHLRAGEQHALIATFEAAARNGRFSMCLTMHACGATSPSA